MPCTSEHASPRHKGAPSRPLPPEMPPDALRAPRLAVRLAACLAAAAVAIAAAAAAPASAVAAIADHVVIVVLDGPRLSECFEEPGHPHIPHIWNELLPAAADIPEFHNEGSTYTMRGHGSILTGTWQNIANDGSEHPTRPTLFEYYRAATGAPARDTWLVGGKAKLQALAWSAHPLYGAPYGASTSALNRPDLDTYADTIDRLTADHPVLSLLAFSEIDSVAHYHNWDGYLRAISRADSLVHELWQWLEADPLYGGHTALFYTHDHGRHLVNWWTHGDGCAGCRRLGFFAIGPDFAAGSISPQTRSQIDICRTVAMILGIPAPLAGGGRLDEIFAGPSGVALGEPWGGGGGGGSGGGRGAARGVLAAFPNPFNPVVHIRVARARPGGPLAVEVVDPQGRMVRRLAGGAGRQAGGGAPGGVLRLTWDGRDARGAPLPSGVYLLVARGGGGALQAQARKITLVR